MVINEPMSPPAIARLLRKKPEVIRGFIESGELEAVNLASKDATRPRWMVMPEALERFLAARSSRSAAEIKQQPRQARCVTGRIVEFF